MAKAAWVGHRERRIDPVWAASDLERRARLLRQQGQVNSAVELYEQALNIRRSQIPGTQHGVLSELGNTHLLLNHQDKATECFAAAVALIQKDCYADHPMLAPILEDWSYCCVRQGDLEQAEELCQRALSIKLKSLLPQDVHTLETMRSLAEILRRLKRYTESETLLKQAMKYLDNSTIGPIEEFLYELALLSQDQGKHAEAEEYFNQALHIFAQRSGKAARFATCLKSYAELLQATERGAEAEQLNGEAQAIIDETAQQAMRCGSQDAPGSLLFQDGIYACTILQ